MATEEALKARLERKRDQLREEIDRRMAELPAYDGSPTDSLYGNHAADRATDTFEEEKALGLRNHFAAELREIEHALRKLETGEYGRCERCDQPIAPERLEALPQVRLCLSCQSRSEARRQ